MGEIVDFAGMKQFVSEPTQITKGSSNKIDSVISNCVQKTEGLQDEIITDLATIKIYTGMFDIVKKPKVFVDWIKDYSAEEIRNKLIRFDWTSASSLSLNERSELLVDRMKQCIGEFIVKIEVHQFEDNKWFDSELIDLRAKRDTSYKLTVLLDTDQAWNKNKSVRNVHTFTCEEENLHRKQTWFSSRE